MGHMIDVHKRNEKMEEMFRQLKTAKVSSRDREILAHFEQWLAKKGFLTPRQYDCFLEIYNGASNGKK